MPAGRWMVLGSVTALAGAVLVPASATALPGQEAALQQEALPQQSALPQQAPPSGTNVVTPGDQVNTDGADCTANFLFTDGADTFLGMAAHCAAEELPTTVDGCDAEAGSLGTPVDIDGAAADGELAYSSWLAMQERGETDEDACRFNDFALVRLDPADAAEATAEVPAFGGPEGLLTGGTESGEQVFTFGNSPLRGGIEALSPKEGFSFGTRSGGWVHEVATVTPGVPGDSGSGFVNADGDAFGVLSTLQLAPVPGSNGVTDLSMALDYANEHGDLGAVELVTAEGSFTPGGALLGGL